VRIEGREEEEEVVELSRDGVAASGDESVWTSATLDTSLATREGLDWGMREGGRKSRGEGQLRGSMKETRDEDVRAYERVKNKTCSTLLGKACYSS
jgi:hypothetical protein